MSAIAINGKFLDAGLNGVHRTAAQFSRQLLRRARGVAPIRLISPRASNAGPEFPELQAEVIRGRLGSGQGWEMLTLPIAARGQLLINFCNLAPLAHGNCVVMIHDAQTFLYPQDYTGKQARAYRRMLPLIGRRARRILTVSEFSRHSLIDHGIGRADKIAVVHNGTDHLLAAPEDHSILTRLGLAPGAYVLTIGSAKRYKNMRTLFDAMRGPLTGGQRLVVAGGPDAATYEAAGWTPPAGTVFTGFVDDGQLRALYSQAAAFVFPSLTEGFGLPPVEAMHCGTPVITARAGAMPEVCADAALSVTAQDAAEYRTALETVLADPVLAQTLRARGLARAGELTWDAAGARLWSEIHRLL